MTPGRKDAIRYEKEAREKSYASKFAQGVKSSEYRDDAANKYERAGDEWIKQFAEEQNPRGLRDTLHYALNDYKFAKKVEGRNSHEIERLNKKINSINKKLDELHEEKGLGKKLYGFLSIASLAFALVLVGFNLTGNAIGGLSSNDSSWIGVCFFLCGLVFTFIYLRQKV